MFRSPVVLVILLAYLGSAQIDQGFVLIGFSSVSSFLNINGATTYTQNGLLQLTSSDYQNNLGHAFVAVPIIFKNSTNGTAFSFSTTFVSALVPKDPPYGGQGMAFVIVKERGTQGSLPSQYLGIFNTTTMGKDSNHIFAVELDTFQNVEFADIDDNHVGIDINGLVSIASKTAGYYNVGGFKNMRLNSGQPIQVWVEYDGTEKLINVTLAPIDSMKPLVPLLSLPLDLTPFVEETMFVGFSAATGGTFLQEHYVLGWSFKTNGQAQELSISKLPRLPKEKNELKFLLLQIGLPLLSACFIIIVVNT